MQVCSNPLLEPFIPKSARVGQISLQEGPLATFGGGAKYIDLFVAALRQYGMLCIGLYRSPAFFKVEFVFKKTIGGHDLIRSIHLTKDLVSKYSVASLRGRYQNIFVEF